MINKLPKSLLLGLCFTLLFMNTQCDEDDEVQSYCGEAVVVDPGYYETATSDPYDLISAEITDNCLNIEFSASGCDGSTWSAVLVDSGDIMESSPEQRNLKLVFSNEELCQAVFEQTRIFDLTNLQIEGSSSILLNIEDFPAPLTYNYE